MYICVSITKQQQITSCMIEIQYLTAKVQKLLQWCSCFKTVISRRPLGRITWPRDWFVAKGLYSIWSHQSEVGFPWVVAGRFAPRFEVSYCNTFWSHCIMFSPGCDLLCAFWSFSLLCQCPGSILNFTAISWGFVPPPFHHNEVHKQDTFEITLVGCF